ncbi:MAG: alpha/beta hydrolase [Clostridiaceae bacterium]|nr:alpha/beta hydrolase [Clostridiaceae bacterium]
MWPILIVLIILTILYLVCNFFYKLAISNGKKTFLTGNKDLPETFLCGICVEGKEWLEKVKKNRYSIKSHDGLNLRGFFIPSTKEDQKVHVIIAHGYNSKSMDMGVYARFFNEEMDFNVLLPDDRGHGESDGKYIGFGWHDRLDYLRWINFLIKEYGQDIEIILFGVSMGGSTVLMVSGEKLPPNVKAVISDCAYTSAWDILSYQLKQMYGLPPFPFIHFTSLLTYFKAGYFLSKASALKQIKKTNIPVFLIHGREDTFVPFNMVTQLYEAAHEKKKLYIVDDAGHAEAIIKDYDNYRENIKEFIRGIL